MSRPTVDPANYPEHFAVVYAPRRRRERLAENCVTLCADEESARAAADPVQNRHAARVRGPFRSSEGLNLFFLIAWLEESHQIGED